MIKNIITVAFMTVCVTTFASDKEIKRVTRGGGENGYNRTVYTETSTNIDIECTDPGHESCPAVPSGISSGVGVEYAIKKINGGVLSGDDTIDVNGARFRVIWSSKSSDDTNSTIQVLPL